MPYSFTTASQCRRPQSSRWIMSAQTPFGRFVQQGRPPRVPPRSVRLESARVERAHLRERLLDLAPQASERLSLLLGDLVVEDAPSAFAHLAAGQGLGHTKGHVWSGQQVRDSPKVLAL